jgi:DUF1680 family protein
MPRKATGVCEKRHRAQIHGIGEEVLAEELPCIVGRWEVRKVMDTGHGRGHSAAMCVAAELFPHFRAYPVSYLQVRLEDSFWTPRQATVRETTVPWVTAAHDAAGGLVGFRSDLGQYVAETTPGDVEHIKFIEAMATVLGVKSEPDVEGLIDSWAKPLMEGQGSDGYLAEGFPVGLTRPPHRWEVAKGVASLEDYAIGHYIEAAIAYREATGKDELYGSALRAAQNLVSSLLNGSCSYVSAHPEIEKALLRLYGTTGDYAYVELCGWFLDQRGHHEERSSYGRRCQDRIPLIEHRAIEGHAVCAAYLYDAVTQYIGATDDSRYRTAVLAVWDDLSQHKTYLHGASGNGSARNEGYLPEPKMILPDDCYGESCAAIGNFQWSHSLFLLTGEARFLDYAEKILYNAFPASLSLEGDRSFYTNVAQTGAPANADGAVTLTAGRRTSPVRHADLATSCCPPNVVKLMNTVGGYLYATDDSGIYVNYYATSSASIELNEQIEIRQRTNFPWDGQVELIVTPTAASSPMTLRLRIPSWAGEPSVVVNGDPFPAAVTDGWLAIPKQWRRGDTVQLSLPMEAVRVTLPRDFKGYENRAALVRGPIVYCLEAIDLQNEGVGRIFEEVKLARDPGAPPSAAESVFSSIYIPEDVAWSAEHRPEFLGGVTVLNGSLRQLDSVGNEASVDATFIPYCVWGNREPTEMRIWLGAKSAPPFQFLQQQAGLDVVDGWE